MKSELYGGDGRMLRIAIYDDGVLTLLLRTQRVHGDIFIVRPGRGPMLAAASKAMSTVAIDTGRPEFTWRQMAFCTHCLNGFAKQFALV